MPSVTVTRSSDSEWLHALPKGPTGKILKRELAQAALSGQ